MTFVPAIVAAAQHLRREEEIVTQHGIDEIEGWEFKIVRAATRKFKDPEFFRQICEEEAQSGWEMLEKFDDSRIRFKRRAENRDRDQHRDIDPYRTQVGMTADQLGLLITMLVFLGVGALMAVVAFIVN